MENNSNDRRRSTQALQNENKAKSDSSSCQGLLNLDRFGGYILFNLGEGNQTYPSKCGASLSLFSFLLTLVFTVQLMMVLFKYQATQFTNAERKEFYDETHTFSAADGFMFAVAFIGSAPDGSHLIGEPDDYLEIKAVKAVY